MRSSADPPGSIPGEADRPFRIVTDDSGHSRKSVTFTRNERSHSGGISGHARAEYARTYLPGHHQCVRIAWNDLTVSSISGSRFVAWHPEVCPTAQAFVRWQREYPWEDLKNPFYQRYSRRVHLVTRSGRGYDAGNKLFAWELLSYFHSCSSIATFLNFSGAAGARETGGERYRPGRLDAADPVTGRELRLAAALGPLVDALRSIQADRRGPGD